MSEVILTKRLFGVPDGAVYPRWFEEGDTVTGGLAEVAVDGGYTEEVKPAVPHEDGADGAPAEGIPNVGDETNAAGTGDDAGNQPSVAPPADDAKPESAPPSGDDGADSAEVTIKHVGGGRYGRFVNGERVGETYPSREEAERGEG